MTRARTYLPAAPVAALLGYLAAHALLPAAGGNGTPVSAARPGLTVAAASPAKSASRSRTLVMRGPGPWRSVAEIPVGFMRSPSGTVAAAGNYLTVLSRTVLPRAPWSWGQAIHALTTAPLSARAAAGSAQSAQVAARLAAAGSSLYLGSWLLGYRVWSYSPDRARVAVWNVGVMTSTVGVVPPTYSTTTCTLRWVDGDWKISDTRVSPGPTPPSSASITQAQATTFTAAADQFRSYRNVP